MNKNPIVNRARTTIAYVIVLLCNCGVRGDFTCFSIKETPQEIKATARSDGAKSAEIKNLDDGSFAFSINGGTSTVSKWYIPVDVDISSSSKIHFEISSTNIRTVQGKPNIYLAIETASAHLRPGTRQDGNISKAKSSQVQEISIFGAAGAKDSALGTLPFNQTDEIIHLDGFYLDLGLLECCSGELIVSELTITSDKNLLPWDEVETTLATPPPVRAKVKTVNSHGDVGLVINGTGWSGLGYSSGNAADHASYASMVNQSGIQLTKTILNFGGEDPFFPDHKSVWKHPDYIDFQYIDQSITRACPAKSNFVIIDVLLNAPPDWWIEKRKEAIWVQTAEKSVQEADLTGANSVSGTPTDTLEAKKASARYFVSDLDPEWMKYGEGALKQLLAHIRKRPYADRVIGCNVSVGIGLNDFPYPHRDKDPNYSQSFQDWLLTKYHDTNTLRESWQDDTIEFADIAPVSSQHWSQGNMYALIHPMSGRHATDSHIFYFMSWTNSLLHFCQLIKSLTHNRYVSGIVGGPGLAFHSLWNNSYQPTSEAIYSLLESSDVDYIEIPVSSSDLRNGRGDSGTEFMLSDILHRYQKLLLLRNNIPFSPSTVSGKRIVRRVEDIIQIQRKIFVTSLINDAMMYFFQTEPNGYEEPFVRKEIKQFQTIRRKASKLSRKKNAEVALVIDFDVFKHLSPGREHKLITSEYLASYGRKIPDIASGSSKASNYFHLFAIPQQTWNRLGASFDIIPIDKLIPDSYKTILLFHTIFLSDRREKVLRECKNKNRYLISTWANGFVTDRYLTTLGIERITGIGTRAVPKRVSFNSTVSPGLEEFIDRSISGSSIGWLGSLREPQRYDQPTFGPCFQVNDDKSVTLATYTDTGKASMAAKRFADWTSIYSASPVINPEIMKEFMRKSGVHIYLDTNDLIYVNDSFIGIYPFNEGDRELNLPEASALYEVFRGQELKKNKTHRIRLQGKKTYLFFRGDRITWESL